MKAYVQRLHRLLASERVRFLVVGAWNTLVGYVIFVALHYAASSALTTAWVLIVSYLIAVPHSFFTQRILVFRAKCDWRPQMAKFFVANSIVFVSNLLTLPVFIRQTGVSAPLAQAVFLVLSTIAMYVLHKQFSFANRTKQGARS